uniref:hypothetical protein n=1 Tax=Azospirillum argentinense TaxID=2970906 RepID=UPI00158600B2|nr:hypothetical protein [Azospirillum argentinense]
MSVRSARSTGTSPRRRAVRVSTASTGSAVSLSRWIASPFTPSSVSRTCTGRKVRRKACHAAFGTPAESTTPQPAPGQTSWNIQTSPPAQEEPARRHSAKTASMTSPVTARDSRA